MAPSQVVVPGKDPLLLLDIVEILKRHKCPDVTAKLEAGSIGEIPLHGGGFGDIYTGRTNGGTKVAIKCARYHIQGHENRRELKLLAHEIHAWSKCDHENVLPFLGMAQHRGRLAIVSPWMENGTLPDYIVQTPDADRLKLCLQVTDGLSYLHQRGIIHGDLKGANVLISETGVPKLADFGSTKLKDQSLRLSNGTSSAYSVRWAAPEILNGSSCSAPADIYALGMTIYETVTGQVPYSDKREVVVITEVLVRRGLPSWNETTIHVRGNKKRLWNFMVECWDHSVSSRPPVNVVKTQLSLIISAPPFVEGEKMDIVTFFARPYHGGILQICHCQGTDSAKREYMLIEVEGTGVTRWETDHIWIRLECRPSLKTSHLRDQWATTSLRKDTLTAATDKTVAQLSSTKHSADVKYLLKLLRLWKNMVLPPRHSPRTFCHAIVDCMAQFFESSHSGSLAIPEKNLRFCQDIKARFLRQTTSYHSPIFASGIQFMSPEA